MVSHCRDVSANHHVCDPRPSPGQHELREQIALEPADLVAGPQSRGPDITHRSKPPPSDDPQVPPTLRCATTSGRREPHGTALSLFRASARRGGAGSAGRDAIDEVVDLLVRLRVPAARRPSATSRLARCGARLCGMASSADSTQPTALTTTVTTVTKPRPNVRALSAAPATVMPALMRRKHHPAGRRAEFCEILNPGVVTRNDLPTQRKRTRNVVAFFRVSP